MNNVCVVTGAGGILCAAFAKEMAKKGYAVALLDLNEAAAAAVAAEIVADGGVAKAYKTNVLDREVLEDVHNQILADLGKCQILINGAGGNSPRATTTHEYYEVTWLTTSGWVFAILIDPFTPARTCPNAILP